VGVIIVQVTDVVVLPFTVAVNCWLWLLEGVKLTDPGVTVTAPPVRPLPISVTVALANTVGCAALVAVIITVWVALTLDGAV